MERYFKCPSWQVTGRGKAHFRSNLSLANLVQTDTWRCASKATKELRKIHVSSSLSIQRPLLPVYWWVQCSLWSQQPSPLPRLLVCRLKAFFIHRNWKISQCSYFFEYLCYKIFEVWNTWIKASQVRNMSLFVLFLGSTWLIDCWSTVFFHTEGTWTTET